MYSCPKSGNYSLCSGFITGCPCCLNHLIRSQWLLSLLLSLSLSLPLSSTLSPSPCFSPTLSPLSLSPSLLLPLPLAAWRSSAQILRPHSEILELTLSIRNKQNKLFPFP